MTVQEDKKPIIIQSRFRTVMEQRLIQAQGRELKTNSNGIPTTRSQHLRPTAVRFTEHDHTGEANV